MEYVKLGPSDLEVSRTAGIGKERVWLANAKYLKEEEGR